MISLNRERTTAAITRALRGSFLRKKLKKLFVLERDFQNGSLDKREFNSDWWKKAKDQLIKESNHKCAYCEADTRVVAHGDVEHYRPKSEYWWLAYCYDNYLFSCQICNQSFKSNNFPVTGPILAGPAVNAATPDADLDLLAKQFCPEPLADDHDIKIQDLADQHVLEDPHLINPYYTNPSTIFSWEFSDARQEVDVIPSAAANDKYVQAAIDFYGLNRPELQRLRYREFKKFRSFKKVLNDPGVNPVLRNEIQTMVDEMIAPEAPFSGMLTFFNGVL